MLATLYMQPWLYEYASVRTIDSFSVYWSNKQNELNDVDKVDEAQVVPEWSTSFSNHEILHSFTRVK